MVTKRNASDTLSRNMIATAHGWQRAGVSPRTLRTLAGCGDLVRMRQGVYATRRAVEWAGDDPVRSHVLHGIAAGPRPDGDAVASYHSAAILHRLDLLKP